MVSFEVVVVVLVLVFCRRDGKIKELAIVKKFLLRMFVKGLIGTKNRRVYCYLWSWSKVRQLLANSS